MTLKKKIKKLYKIIIFNNDVIFYLIMFILSVVMYIYLRFVILTSKITYKLHNNNIEDLKNNTYILAFWHGRLLSSFFVRKYFTSASVLISYNKSAILVKFMAKYFFTSVTQGSSNKSDLSGIRNILNALKKPKHVFAIAPDGSIGPRLYVKEGVATIGLLSKAPILLGSYSAKFAIILNTWDKFMIPLPFNHIIVEIEDPIDPLDSKFNKDPAIIRSLIENKLTNKLYELDEKFGHPKITQATMDKKRRPLSTIK